MKKGVARSSVVPIDNSLGVTGVVLGILSLVSSIALTGAAGIILGIIAIVFAVKQQNRAPNSWGKAGKILAIIGIILGIVSIISSYYLLPGFLENLQTY